LLIAEPGVFHAMDQGYLDWARPYALDQAGSFFATRAKKNLDVSRRLLRQISGQPFRIKYLERVYEYLAKFKGVVHWNGEQILEWYVKARMEAK